MIRSASGSDRLHVRGRQPEGFLFEAVSEVRTPAPQPGSQARGRIRHEEQETEALVLPDMDTLVRPKCRQNLMALADDHVTERDAGKSGPRCPAGDFVMSGREREFERVTRTPATAARAQHQQSEQHADGAAGKRPEQPQDEDGSLMVVHMRPAAATRIRRRNLGHSR